MPALTLWENLGAVGAAACDGGSEGQMSEAGAAICPISRGLAFF